MTEAPVAAPQAQPEEKFTPLTQEERNDLRRRVLSGYKMSVEEARAVYLTLRAGQGAVAITGEASKKPRRAKKAAYEDAQLDADLKDLGVDI